MQSTLHLKQIEPGLKFTKPYFPSFFEKILMKSKIAEFCELQPCFSDPNFRLMAQKIVSNCWPEITRTRKWSTASAEIKLLNPEKPAIAGPNRKRAMMIAATRLTSGN